jgi:hypothetical protein
MVKTQAIRAVTLGKPWCSLFANLGSDYGSV